MVDTLVCTLFIVKLPIDCSLIGLTRGDSNPTLLLTLEHQYIYTLYKLVFLDIIESKANVRGETQIYKVCTLY